ncbi:UNKNOWN [Stylonychia lemnae]|uniref:Transmembrane protein n=1 Tax=Stylonychia lemnae TaxID=5949 RepID=A0A078AHW8_STYLE|nr:UNKNOWN [Stylonychia lemnae]|eukprot:CDW81844.1 UNKNOWN [Stylonychia lemnae]
MKLLDPLSGYRITSQISFFQLGFTVAMSHLSFQDEFDPDNRDYAILFLIISHISFAVIDYGRVLLQKFRKTSIIITGTLNFVSTAAYQVVIFYAQVKYLNSEINEANFGSVEEFETKESRALNWLMIEIAVYYFQVGLTVIFLLLQIFLGLEIKCDKEKEMELEMIRQSKAVLSRRISRTPTPNQQLLEQQEQEEQKTPEQEQQQENKSKKLTEQEGEDSYDGGKDNNFSLEYQDFWSNLRQDQDFLALINDQLQQFLFYGIIFTVSLFVICVQDHEEYENKEFSYFYPILALTILFGILFLYTIIDLFTKYKEPECMKKYFLKVMLGLIFIDLTYMVVDLFIFGVQENLERYWIMTVVSIAISYIITEIIVRFLAKNDDHLQRQKDIMFAQDKEEKRTLIHPHSKQIDLEDDIYAITILSFNVLDKRRKIEVQLTIQSAQSVEEESISLSQEENLLQQPVQQVRPEVQRAPVTYVEASKNFSTCVIIFLIQMALIILMFIQLKSSDKNVELLFSVFLTRILCSFLLHMRLESEIYQAIQLFNYARLMVYYKDNRLSMLMVSGMQFVGAFFTEIINIYLIASQNTVADVLINYIALGVIAEIDNIYAKSLQHNTMRAMIADGVTLEYNEENPARPGYQKNKSLAKILYKIIRVYYESYYYYFMPFTVVGLTFLFIMF